MTDWQALADRWTFSCKKCGERLNYRGTDGNGVCDNPHCVKNPDRTQPGPPPTSDYHQVRVVGVCDEGLVGYCADVIGGENVLIICKDCGQFKRWATPSEAKEYESVYNYDRYLEVKP